MTHIGIFVDDKFCYKFALDVSILNVKCTTHLTGQLVKVKRFADAGMVSKSIHTLILCEVEVWGKYFIF